jgi:transglutaminase-like putative cysteine protease
MAKYHLKHITRYTYPTPIKESINHIMLFPMEDDKQEVRKHEILISHLPTLEVFTDYFGNKVGVFSISKPIKELQIQSKLEVTVHDTHLNVPAAIPAAEWQALSLLDTKVGFIDYLWADKEDDHPEMVHIINELSDKSVHPFLVAQRFSSYVFHHFEYKKGITDVETQVNEIWNLKAGVCQDFAHVLLPMLRHTGIPARYVSGYICPKNHELRGEGATHAWVEAFIPEFGWIGLDPTNDCLTNEQHIRLAIGRNFTDCTPMKGTYKGSSEHILEVAVVIENGLVKSELDSAVQPVFTYQVHRLSTESENSYRKFVEMQQQQ